MTVVCAWCQSVTGTKPGPDVTTHGCCPSCLASQLRADGFGEETIARLAANSPTEEVSHA